MLDHAECPGDMAPERAREKTARGDDGDSEERKASSGVG